MRDVSGAGSDARPPHFNILNLELHEECLRTLGVGWNNWGYKRTQLGSSKSGSSMQLKHRGTAADRGAVEADTIGEQQLKQMQTLIS